MLQVLAIIIVFCSGYLEVYPQENNRANRKHTIGLTWGLHDYRSQDFIFSPRIYRGKSLLLGELFYQHKNQRAFHEASLSMSRITMRPSTPFSYLVNGQWIETSPSETVVINLRYAYAKNIFGSNKVEFLAGGLLNSNFNFMEYHLGQSMNDGTAVFCSMSVLMKTTFSLSQNQSLNIETAFPLISWIARSTFSITDDDRLQASSDLINVIGNGRPEFLTKFLNINSRFSYRKWLSKNLGLQAVYYFEYIKYTNPQKITILKNSFQVGCVYAL